MALGLLDEAEAAEDVGDHEAAVRAYRALAEIVELPQVRLREAAALVGSGELDDALDLYEELAALDGLRDVAREANRAARDLLEGNPVTYVVEVSPVGARLSIDGGEPIAADVPAEGTVARGEHTFSVTADGYAPVEWTVTLAIGDTHTRSVDLEPLAVVVAEPLADEEHTPIVVQRAPDPRRPSWIPTVALGAGTLGTGAVAGAYGLRARNRGEAHDEDPYGDPDDALADEARRAQRTANALIGVSAALGVGTLVSAIVTAGDDDRGVDVSTSIGGGGATLRAGWRW